MGNRIIKGHIGCIYSVCKDRELEHYEVGDFVYLVPDFQNTGDRYTLILSDKKGVEIGGIQRSNNKLMYEKIFNNDFFVFLSQIQSGKCPWVDFKVVYKTSDSIFEYDKSEAEACYKEYRDFMATHVHNLDCFPFVPKKFPESETFSARSIADKASDLIQKHEYEKARKLLPSHLDEERIDDAAIPFLLGVLAEKESDWKEAFHFYKVAAKNGFMEAYYNLSKLYLKGLGIRKNTKLSFKYMQKAANENDGEAWNDLGIKYEQGCGVEMNWDEAFNCYVNAHLLGEPRGTLSLGLCYLKGRGAPINFEKGVSMLESAVSRLPQDAFAFYALGTGYEFCGDLDRAIETWKQAARLGSLDACNILGELGISV